MTRNTAISRHVHLSLKWKAILLPSLILAGLFLGTSWLLDQRLTKNFDQARQEINERQHRQVNNLIQHSASRLTELTELLPSLLQLGHPVLNHDREQLKKILGQHWPDLEINQALEHIALFDKDNQLLVQWGSLPAMETLLKGASQWVAQVNEHETPITHIGCANQCVHIAAVPVIADGEHAGVLMVSRSLAEALIDFQQASAIDMGLLVSTHSANEDLPTLREIPQWGVNIAALSNDEARLALIKQAAIEHPNACIDNSSIRVSQLDQHFEISFIPLNIGEPSQDHKLLTIQNITSSIQSIEKTSNLIKLIGVLGMLAAIATLLFALWKPTSRLRNTALALPLLPRHHFALLRSKIHPPQQPTKLHDEIDVLEQVALDINDELERLAIENRNKTDALDIQVQATRAEKEFAEQLLDTAQAVILTQDNEGRIRSMNAFGEALTGYSEAELSGQPFTYLLADSDVRTSIDQWFTPLMQGDQKQIRHETRLLTRDGVERDMEWIHALSQGSHAKASHSDATHPNDITCQHIVISVGIDITEAKRTQTRMRWLAGHDPLTHLFNRDRFVQEIEQNVASVLRKDKTGALLCIGLDNFKDINDISGPNSGNQMLRMVADRLNQTLRHFSPPTPHAVGRLGGDEFGVLLKKADRGLVEKVIEQICVDLAKISLSTDHHHHHITASTGIAMIPDHGSEASELLSNAYLSLYKAKSSGRDNWHFFTPNKQERKEISQRVFWRERIEEALARDRFRLQFQPQLNLKTGVIDQYEALLRMVAEDGTLIPPLDFIPIAERNGLITRIDQHVIRAGIRTLARLQRSGQKLQLGINLSARAFDQPDLPGLLQDSLREFGADPSMLTLEPTETDALSDIESSSRLMSEIRALGCKFSLDDFGVGFTSFHYLRELPVDSVKVDASFIQNLANHPENQAIVQALASVAQGFNQTCVAEGVDSEATLALIKHYGITHAQGFYIGKPASSIPSTGKI